MSLSDEARIVNVEAADAWAILKSLELALSRQSQEVIVESDALAIVQRIYTPTTLSLSHCESCRS